MNKIILLSDSFTSKSPTITQIRRPQIKIISADTPPEMLPIFLNEHKQSYPQPKNHSEAKNRVREQHQLPFSPKNQQTSPICTKVAGSEKKLTENEIKELDQFEDFMFAAEKTDIDLPCVELKDIQIRSVVNHLNPSLQSNNIKEVGKFNDKSEMFVGSFDYLFALNVFEKQKVDKGLLGLNFEKKASEPLRTRKSNHPLKTLRGSEGLISTQSENNSKTSKRGETKKKRDQEWKEMSGKKGKQLGVTLKPSPVFTPRQISFREYNGPRSKQLICEEPNSSDLCNDDPNNKLKHNNCQDHSAEGGYEASESIAEEEFSVSRRPTQSRLSGVPDSIDKNLERCLEQKNNNNPKKSKNIVREKRNSIRKYQGVENNMNLLGIPQFQPNYGQQRSLASVDDNQASDVKIGQFRKLGRLHSANPDLCLQSEFSKLTPILESQSSLSDDILKDQGFDSELFENGFKSVTDC